MENLLSGRLQIIRHALWVLAAIMLASLWFFSADDMPTERNKKMVAMEGDVVDYITFNDLSGKPISLKKFKGKPVILNVWATWCKPCVKEMPSLNALAAEGKYHVVAVSTDGDSAKIQSFIKEHGLNDLSVLWDANGAVSRKQLLASSLPITYIIDKNVVLRGVERGERDWHTMQNKIDELTKVSP